jgi:hypothetical protein
LGATLIGPDAEIDARWQSKGIKTERSQAEKEAAGRNEVSE